MRLCPSRTKSLTVERIRELYDGNWVLVGVTGYDEWHSPARGKVLAYSQDRFAINDALKREREMQKPGAKKGMFFIFFAEPRLTSGPEFEKAAARIVADLRRALARRACRPG